MRYEADGVEELGEDKIGDLIKLSDLGSIQDAKKARLIATIFLDNRYQREKKKCFFREFRSRNLFSNG